MDLPLQHCDEKILKAMNRTGNVQTLKKLIGKIRTYIPDMVIRTTFITGFPGEGEKEFETLAEFVKEIAFDRLGCFTYSPQEGTPAAKMDGQVEEQVKVRRGELIMEEQFRIVEEKNEALMGKTLQVMVQGYDDYTDCYYGRSYMDAPEIDTLVYFTSPNPYTEGDFVDVVLFDVQDYDLVGKEDT
ncbi:Ribosomal protein S12 methylthiotransferase RimO [bioreactor metagenome]|uniref:Ribosomal protein S12 methylthiotransferase RimO n=1 Tax=bioreactor metagenome TaxID=1076179 RepID=A0A645F7E6_9ZZZZ